MEYMKNTNKKRVAPAFYFCFFMNSVPLHEKGVWGRKADPQGLRALCAVPPY